MCLGTELVLVVRHGIPNQVWSAQRYTKVQALLLTGRLMTYELCQSWTL